MKSTGLSDFRLKCSRGLGFILDKGAKVNKRSGFQIRWEKNTWKESSMTK